jgi:hypothetical protein
VVSGEPAIEFVLYSEDRADADADFAALREVLLGMLGLVCPAVKTNHVRISPVQPVRKQRICGSYWKDRESAKAGAQQHRRELIRAVATELRLGRVVFFHVDADAVYRERERCAHLCEQWPRFRRDVGSVLARPGAAMFVIDEALILAMPFFEMESWAFANVDYLRGVLAQEHELAALSRWADALGELDEIADIKDLLTLSQEDKQALVRGRHGFPAQRLADAGKSYARTVERLRGSPVVARGLAEAAARAY